MTNKDKAAVYDDLLRESDFLQRENSKLRSEYPINPPQHVIATINKNDLKLGQLVRKLEGLFNG